MCICVSLCKKGKVLMIYAKICTHSRSHKYCEKKIFKKWSRFSPQIAYGMYVGLCRAIWYIFLSSLRYLAICSIQELKNAKSICNKGYNSYFWLSARKDQPTNGDTERKKNWIFDQFDSLDHLWFAVLWFASDSSSILLLLLFVMIFGLRLLCM